MRIERDVWIEDLVREFSASVGFLREKGIRCIACGEPIWGTLEQAAREKGFSEPAIDELVIELRTLWQGAPVR